MFSADLGPDDAMGRIKISCSDIIANPEDPSTWEFRNINEEEDAHVREGQWFPLVGTDGMLNGAEIKMSVVFKPVEKLIELECISDSYFAQTTVNNVTLYQARKLSKLIKTHKKYHSN